jgi:uncharacterized radical SAM protein YgiQ
MYPGIALRKNELDTRGLPRGSNKVFHMLNNFLPISKSDMQQRKWDALDVILISGDAYVDHPSYGIVIIGRVLENAGYKVGIIAQPNWRNLDDFTRLGKPKLFFGISAGNLDSMVANYTANKRTRQADDYAAGGVPGRRPDRATIVYANKIREAFPEIPIVLGGIEASLRRFAHYDFWSNSVRGSILLDSRADILVYGPGEGQILEIAQRLKKGLPLTNIRGTAFIEKNMSNIGQFIEMPSCEDVKSDTNKFNEAFRLFYSQQDPFRGKTLVQRHAGRFVVQSPPAFPLSPAELDKIFELPFMHRWHPSYEKEGGVPGFNTVQFSLISNRGCCGECSFCSLYAHQGRIVQSRSQESLLREATTLSVRQDFRGTITDIGGPTANLYLSRCGRWKREGACAHRQCLKPKKCKHLTLGYQDSIALYKEILKIPRVKHLFIESGFRYDLLVDAQGKEYLECICKYHVSGQMKVAPEHSVEKILELMNKPSFAVYEDFVQKFKATVGKLKNNLYLVNYFISGHPGATLQDTLELALYLMHHKIKPQQIQDFIPLPSTLAGCMFYTGKHPLTGQSLYVPHTTLERKMQRALIQYFNPKNRDLIRQALTQLGKKSLLKSFMRASS